MCTVARFPKLPNTALDLNSLKRGNRMLISAYYTVDWTILELPRPHVDTASSIFIFQRIGWLCA